LGGAALAAALYAWNQQERARHMAILQDFQTHWQEFDWRLRAALAGSAPVALDPTFLLLARRNRYEALRSVVSSVHQQVAWTDDRVTCGEIECWQTLTSCQAPGRQRISGNFGERSRPVSWKQIWRFCHELPVVPGGFWPSAARVLP